MSRHTLILASVLILWSASVSCIPSAGAGDIYVLPSGDSLVLYARRSSGPEPLATLGPLDRVFPTPPHTYGNAASKLLDSLRHLSFLCHQVACDPSSGWIAAPMPGDSGVNFWRYERKTGLTSQSSFGLPKGWNLHAMTFVGPVLYVGGRSDREILGFIDPRSKPPQWVIVPVDSQITRYGKAVDGFVLQGNRLIAIDDIVFPKYVLEYNIANPLLPQQTRRVELEAHGVYEHIREAVGNEWRIALFSSTSGRMAWEQHVALLDPLTLEEVNTLTNIKRADRWFGYSELQADTGLIWESVALINNFLLISAGKRGVGRVNMRALPMTSRTENLSSSISYSMPASTEGAHILRVVPFPEHDVAVLVIVRDSLLETESVPIHHLLQ